MRERERSRGDERGVRRAPNFHRARFITGCARGGEKRIGGKDGGATTHYYEAELPNFAGRYVVSTSRSPAGSGRERRAAMGRPGWGRWAGGGQRGEA